MNNYPDWLQNTVSPQHLWKMQNSNADDGTSSNNRPLGYVTSGTVGYVSDVVLCEDTSYSLKIEAVSSTEIQDADDINTKSLQIRQVGGWFRFTQDVLCPTSIYKEGGGVNNLAILMGFGNVPEAQVADKDDFYVQEIRSKPLKPNKNYHLFVQFSGTNYHADLRFYINGRRVDTQITRDPIEKTTLAGHSGDVVWGKSDSSLYMGSVAVSFGLDQTQYYSCWLSESSTLYSEELIFQMFEYGAIPLHVVTSQSDVDALSGTHFEDEALAIRVDVDGDIELTFDNITFDEWTSIQVQYTGTGKLTIYRKNGTNVSADRCTTPNGGTIEIIDVLKLTLENLVEGSEVRVYDANTLEELSGVESVSGSTYVHEFLGTELNRDVRIVVYHIDYNPVEVVTKLEEKSIYISQVKDKWYYNP